MNVQFVVADKSLFLNQKWNMENAPDESLACASYKQVTLLGKEELFLSGKESFVENRTYSSLYYYYSDQK